jgi:hypothetical protein
MRYILIAGGMIGLLLGFGWMMDSRWGESSLIRGAALFVGAAVSLAIGLAICDIVGGIKRLPDRAGSHMRPPSAEPSSEGKRGHAEQPCRTNGCS